MIERWLLSAVVIPLFSLGLLPPVDPADEATTIAPPPAAAPAGGVPYGPFLPDWSDMGSLYTGGWLPLSPTYVYEPLEQVQDAAASVAVRLVGGDDHYQNSDGTFNLGLWKDRVDDWEGINIDEYINDGTILVHYLIDEPKCVSCWGGKVVPNDVLDEMAAYSKERWPNMATAVRVSPTVLAEHAGGKDVAWPDWEWIYLDTAWTQYASRKGDIVEHAIAEQAAAVEQGLGLIVGLNVLTGGDGSSGLSHPDYPDKWTMSISELNTYARALLDNTSACAFIMWRNDYGGFPYFERSDVRDTVEQLADYAAGKARAPCSRRDDSGPRFYDLDRRLQTTDERSILP